MFDWNDEEFANVIWGEAGESGDHIVPYPDGSEEKSLDLFGYIRKKESNQEPAGIKAAEKKHPIAKTDFHGSNLKNNLQYDTGGLLTAGFGMESWPDLSLSNAAKSGLDSMDETAHLGNDSEIFQNQHEDKEQGDFLDYDWESIGSFDDLNRLLSNNEPIFGHANELWSSPKDVANCPAKSTSLSLDPRNSGFGALRNASEHFEIKTEYMLEQDQSFSSGNEKLNDLASFEQQKLQTNMQLDGVIPSFNSDFDAKTIATSQDLEAKFFSCVQVNRKKSLVESQKLSEEKSEARQLQDLSGVWSPSANQCQLFDGLNAPPMGQPCSSPVFSQPRQLQGSECLQYKHLSNPLLPPVCGNMANQYPSVPLLTQFHSGEGNYQLVPSGYEVSPGNSNPLNKSADAPVKALLMTPQEKIEKLRRRQQMRAMLAIQKQQQQLHHQVSCTEHTVAQTCSHESQMMLIKEGNIEAEENLNILPSPDPSLPIEQDNSNTVSMAIDECPTEDTILHQLQEHIAKLDNRTRICIQDSLFRLAQSAMQRQYARENGNTRDELEVWTKEEINSHDSFTRMPDVETQTNSIDRTVAHLLFHTPLEFLGKLPDALETTVSAKIPYENKMTDLTSLPTGILADSYKSTKAFSHQGSKVPSSIAEGDTSENASNNEAADGGSMEVEVAASQ